MQPMFLWIIKFAGPVMIKTFHLTFITIYQLYCHKIQHNFAKSTNTNKNIRDINISYFPFPVSIYKISSHKYSPLMTKLRHAVDTCSILFLFLDLYGLWGTSKAAIPLAIQQCVTVVITMHSLINTSHDDLQNQHEYKGIY